jgi:hypothetical protein
MSHTSHMSQSRKSMLKVRQAPDDLWFISRAFASQHAIPRYCREQRLGVSAVKKKSSVDNRVDSQDIVSAFHVWFPVLCTTSDGRDA